MGSHPVPQKRLLTFGIISFLCLRLDEGYAQDINQNHFNRLKSYMDLEADPCDDYYQFACGNWTNVHKDATYTDIDSMIDHQVNQSYARIFNILRRQRSRENQPQFVLNALNYLEACVNLEDYSPEEYLSYIGREEQVKWPTTLPDDDSQEANEYDWLYLLATLRKYGLNDVFVESTVFQYLHNASRSYIDIGKIFSNGGFRKTRLDDFKLIIEDFLQQSDKEEVNRLWDTIVRFEERIGVLDHIEDDKYSSGIQTVSELNIDWIRRYLNVLLDKEVDSSMEINVVHIPYLKALFPLLDDYPPEFLCRYLMIRFLIHLHNEGPSNISEDDCIAHTRSTFPLAMEYLYEKHNVDLGQGAKDEIEKLFHSLIANLKAKLNENEQNLEPEDLNFLLTKADAMRIKVGNLPRPNTEEKLSTFYTNVSTDASDFYANHLQLLYFKTQARLDLLEQIIPQNDSFFYLEDKEFASSWTPYYLSWSNIVIVPWTLLQMPLYHPDLHKIFKYSGIGFDLSYVINYGFDKSVLDDYHAGKIGEPSDQTTSNPILDANLNCFLSKNQQTIDGIIADVSGFRLAYESYFQNGSVGEVKDRNPFPYDVFSAEQIFFLNFAQGFCGAVTDKSPVEFSSNDSDWGRITDAFANLKEFGNVYNCPTGSRMNPAKKCQLWR